MTLTIPEQTTHMPTDDNSDVVLSVNGLSKKFCRNLKRSLFYGMQDIAQEVIGLRVSQDKLRNKEFWALKDVSFQLRRGEALGLIGKNGSGKSTLLRTIAGLIKPDTGKVEVMGRVAPLIALGAGFNPVLTGRENIYVNMSILGMSKEEIDGRFDEVVEFAEIGDAIDMPVQNYSSGMAARLGFASAIHTQSDILLMDEVLAVGDIKFRCKCYRMLNKLRKNGTSIVLVSHSANSILSICDTGVYLSEGQLIATGEVSEIVNQYERDLFVREIETTLGQISFPEKNKAESLGLDILSLCFKDKEGNIIPTPVCGKPVYFCIECKAHEEIKNACVDVLIKDQVGEGEWMLRLTNAKDDRQLHILSGRQEIQMRMPYCCLRPGVFVMKLSIQREKLDYLDAVESFKFSVIESENMSNCMFYQPREWEIVSKDTPI
jgi:lipopolysaccharide transport system ATP-binding protein